MLVFDILKNPSEVNIIEQTECLDEYSNIDSLYEAYKQKYEIITSKLIQEIGQSVNNEHKFLKDFHLYLIEYTVLKWQENYSILGYGQNDQETPIFLISQKLT